MGYHRAGFEVVGVDNKKQPHYPFEFHQADAMTYPLEGFDVIHASPPCQHWVDSANKDKHPDLITPLRPRLAGKTYVIENVDCAPLIDAIMLCGTMFGLKVIRHRLFECRPAPLTFPPATCNHWGTVTGGDFAGVYGRGARGRRYGRGQRDARPFACGQVPKGKTKQEWWGECLGIDWMTANEMTQAIPPAYTKWIGEQIKERVARHRVTHAGRRV